MKAVFLDRGTFLDEVDLPAPSALDELIVYTDTPQDNETILERCKDADIIMSNRIKFDRALIEQLTGVRLIQLTATGMNNVDKQACADAGITVYNVEGYAVKSVPEHTLMLMLMGMRAAIYYHQKVAAGVWGNTGNPSPIDIPLQDLEDKTLGIIGVGTIGKKVTEIAKAFGMTVLWAEHQGKTPRDDSYTKFETVLAQADVISLHCPLTEDTKHLINTETLAQMKRCPLIVNVARGGVVESQAMAEAVKNNQVSGYATDVFEKEPIQPDDPLLCLKDHPRVIYSPHNAWGSITAQQTLWQTLTDQVNQFVKANQNQ